MIGFNFVKIWGGFAGEGGFEAGHGCMCKGGKRLQRCVGRNAGACRALARAKLLTMAAAFSLHLPPTSHASTTRRQRLLLRSSG